MGCERLRLQTGRITIKARASHPARRLRSSPFRLPSSATSRRWFWAGFSGRSGHKGAFRGSRKCGEPLKPRPSLGLPHKTSPFQAQHLFGLPHRLFQLHDKPSALRLDFLRFCHARQACNAATSIELSVYIRQRRPPSPCRYLSSVTCSYPGAATSSQTSRHTLRTKLLLPTSIFASSSSSPASLSAVP